MAVKKPATTKKKPVETADKLRLRVRMYRQGLGDCFLLTFTAGSAAPFHLLIDCGVVLGTSEPKTIMTRVLNDIVTETKGHINLVVATHEHWDHVSGYTQVRELFDTLTVDDVWVAWTEDPSDKLATKLRAERRTAENALRLAVQHLALSGATETSERVESLVGFFGVTAGSTEEALDYIKKRAGKKLRFCEPGEPPIELFPGVRIFVLGPPKDEKLIKKSNPGVSEAYGLDAGPGGSQAFLISALQNNMGGTDGPFDRTYEIPMGRSQQLPFFQTRYYGSSVDDSLYDKAVTDDQGKTVGAEVRDQSWRRIDSTWMDASETLALRLDSATNNTSLALAIELTGTGDILLFPGDAQAGNWLSWQALKWELKDKISGEKKTVTGPDLLARTLFYKVGHHGSHNATLKAKGLELMVNSRLMAMIPVDHEMAVKKRWGLMPLKDLVDRLKEKTHGRVLRVDDKVTTVDDLAKLKPAKSGDAEWREFTDRVGVSDLFYDLTFDVSLPGSRNPANLALVP